MRTYIAQMKPRRMTMDYANASREMRQDFDLAHDKLREAADAKDRIHLTDSRGCTSLFLTIFRGLDSLIREP